MMETRQKALHTARKLALAAVIMFGFGYAMVPLYDVLCKVTGLNGKTGEISVAKAKTSQIDPNRFVTVEFDTNVNPSLPWEFKAAKHKAEIRPGRLSEAVFVVENKSNRVVIGQAVPSVAPSRASLFFNKTECFCFARQLLEPGERKEIIVRFIVDSRLPEKIKRMTLSYTFFRAPEREDIAALK